MKRLFEGRALFGAVACAAAGWVAFSVAVRLAEGTRTGLAVAAFVAGIAGTQFLFFRWRDRGDVLAGGLCAAAFVTWALAALAGFFQDDVLAADRPALWIAVLALLVGFAGALAVALRVLLLRRRHARAPADLPETAPGLIAGLPDGPRP
ncbi:hypothetical protein [Actinomadura parmotrematis]|uniref:MFS transporter n=1 Tax=Actinomadura parmotrematis TaxID=2864039 RepID=A0ABS7G084_9ACTN|nr:hypothetical protein [Actinomadura parmotrematis]MBW8485800.1 hypothetical protein [Actinomadura parmotrematis]